MQNLFPGTAASSWIGNNFITLAILLVLSLVSFLFPNRKGVVFLPSAAGLLVNCFCDIVLNWRLYFPNYNEAYKKVKMASDATHLSA